MLTGTRSQVHMYMAAEEVNQEDGMAEVTGAALSAGMEAAMASVAVVQQTSDTPDLVSGEIGDSDEEQLRVHGSAIQGRRNSMEDEIVAMHHRLEDDRIGVLAAVFDGHGGSGVSNYLKLNLYNTLQHHLTAAAPQNPNTRRPVNEFREILVTALRQLDDSVLNQQEWGTTGSTALVAWHLDASQEESNNTGEHKSTVIVANIGDSRAVLGRVVSVISEEIGKSTEQQQQNQPLRKLTTAVTLTRDHKPDDPDEQQRIESIQGGYVTISDYDVPRVNGLLSVSRAIGDALDRPFVSGEPEIRIHEVGENLHLGIIIDDGDDGIADETSQLDLKVEQEFVILATDGLWDVMTAQEAVKFVVERVESGMPTRDIPLDMVQEAFRKDSFDNIAVVILWLKSPR